MASLPQPDDPVRVALIGAGSRSSGHYRPALQALSPWLDVVAVCDPVEEHADEFAESLDIEAYYDIYRLVEDQPMEAAIAVTPIPSHHSISMFMSRNGVHNMVETTMASTLVQGRQMVEAAAANDVVMRVAENFFRKPIDRIVQRIIEENGLEGVKRIFCYNDHTGYHNNSRWIRFVGEHPDWVQSIRHTIPTAPFDSTPERHHESETFRGRFFSFPEGTMVVDQASNIKAFLGRHPRPGYTEWHGRQGTVVNRAIQDRPHDGRSAYSKETEAEVRYTSDEALKLSVNAGRPDEFYPVEHEITDEDWIRSTVEVPDGRELRYENPLRLTELCGPDLRQDLEVPYDIEIMGHLVDFALAVHGIREGEFTDEDALAAMEMEAGARESARRNGERVDLPIDGVPPADQEKHESLEAELGVDPLDVDAMLQLTYPKP